MIPVVPRLDTSNIEFFIEQEVSDFGVTGAVSLPLIREFYNIFSWIYVKKYIPIDKIEHEGLVKVLSHYNLYDYIGPSIAYSAVFFYMELSKKYNMVSLGKGKVVSVEDVSNKLIKKDHFMFDELYDMYDKCKGDLSDDFLEFNSIFTKKDEKDIRNIKAVGDVLKVTSKTSLIRPDFEYKLSSKQLQVGYNTENDGEESKMIYVLQDCTESTKKYIKQINMVKAFILNEAFKHDYKVTWHFVEQYIVGTQEFSKETIKQTKIENIIHGYKVNVTKILTNDEYLGKQVILITDGTDSFDFKFNTKTRNINVVSLTDNNKIKNKISHYGKFFRVHV